MTRHPNSYPIKGHRLMHEGAPHDEDGHRIDTGFRDSTAAGTGHALCECGASSEELPSRNKRAAWHRKHKTEIREQQKGTQ